MKRQILSYVNNIFKTNSVMGGETIKIKSFLMIYFAIFVFFSFLLLNYSIISMDEIWCFGYSRLFAEGYTPYKDFILIQTPFFVWIGSIFANSLVTFRIFGALLSSSVIFMSYYICKRNNCSNFATIIIIEINLLLVILILFANYNMMLLLALLLCYNMADRYFERYDVSSAFVFGIALSMTFLVKQNISAALIVAFTAILIHDIFAKKIKLKTICAYALGGLIPAIVFFTIIYMNGSLNLFLHYAVFGLKSFGDTIFFQSGSIFFIICSLIITATYTYQFMKAQINKQHKLVVLVFSGCSYLWIYPLIDVYHSLLLLIFQVSLLSSITIKTNKRFKYVKLKPVIVALLIVLIMSLTSAKLISDRADSVRSNIEPYQGIYVSKSIEKNLLYVSNYIKQNEQRGFEVAVIDATAYLYNLAADDFNGILDNPLNGNLGVTTEDEIITALMKSDIILVDKKEMGINSQKCKDYISDNFQKSDLVGRFIVYKKL